MDYKQRIIEEASQMFRTYGIRSVTMDMLASRMGISKRTIYEVFRDKDELLHGVLKWMTGRQQELMAKLFSESGNIIEAIFKMLKLMSDHFSKMSPAFQLDVRRHHQDILKQIGERNELPYYASNSEILKRGIAEGVFRKDIDVEITNKCLLEVVKMSYDEDVFPPDAFLNKDVIKNFYINYLRGISTPKGLELIEYYQNKEII
jgi:TetR/AcrR family transcriptional regulator, cholesterol catabolism regulator